MTIENISSSISTEECCRMVQKLLPLGSYLFTQNIQRKTFADPEKGDTLSGETTQFCHLSENGTTLKGKNLLLNYFLLE